MQASRLSQLDKRFVLCGASVPAPRPTVCRQAWLRKQVAAAQQGVPAEASAVCAVQSTWTVHGSDCGRPYHSSSWWSASDVGWKQLAGSLQVLPRPQDMDGRPKSRLSVLIVSKVYYILIYMQILKFLSLIYLKYHTVAGIIKIEGYKL